MNNNPTPDYDGCRRTCRLAGAHTLVYGECEHAPEPDPTVSVSHVYVAADGQPALGFDTYTVTELADLIEPGLRAVTVRLGPNALGMLERGETVALSGGEYADLARVAAHAIVHRHEPAVPAAGLVAVPPTTQTADRAALSAKLWQIAEHHIVAEWICCEPLAPKHDLCAKGYDALGMAKTLLVDSPEAWNPAAPVLDAVLAELEQLRRERDLAIAHDRQPYPTVWAYEQVCKALHRKTDVLDQVRAMHRKRTERHGSGCVQCGIVWPCPTYKALDEDELRRLAAETQPSEPEDGDDLNGALIEEYLRFLRGQGPEPDLSGLAEEQRATVTGQFEIVKALADRDPELPPLDRDPVARRLGLHSAETQPDTQAASTPCPDPIECGHEAALGQAKERITQVRMVIATHRAHLELTDPILLSKLDRAAAVPAVGQTDTEADHA